MRPPMTRSKAAVLKSALSGQTDFYFGIIVQGDVDDGAIREVLRFFAQGN